MMTNLRRGALMLFLLFSQSNQASEPLWLSDRPPDKASKGKLRQSHGGPVERGPGGVYRKRLWVRSGKTPVEADYVLPQGEGSVQLIIPDRSHA
ncbi:MAG: hypothetical protein P8163_08450, partial [Candidatus Thiodiazotropha sp.]